MIYTWLVVYFLITGTEKIAKIIDKIGIPKALNETQSSVVIFLQAISLARAIETNIKIHNLVRTCQPVDERSSPVDIILLRGL